MARLSSDTKEIIFVLFLLYFLEQLFLGCFLPGYIEDVTEEVKQNRSAIEELTRKPANEPANDPTTRSDDDVNNSTDSLLLNEVYPRH